MEDTPQGPQDGAPPPPPPPAEPPPREPAAKEVVSENRNVMIVLAYLWLLALIPLLVDKEDREVQWHAKHGLVLTVVEVVVMIGLQVVVMILGADQRRSGVRLHALDTDLHARHSDRARAVYRQGNQRTALPDPGCQRVRRQVLENKSQSPR